MPERAVCKPEREVSRSRSSLFFPEGRKVVVDGDLEKFFYHVGHDMLIDRYAYVLPIRGGIQLIRAGTADQWRGRAKPLWGAARRSALSPLLANVLLDEVDGSLSVEVITLFATMRMYRFAAVGLGKGYYWNRRS